MRRIAVLSAGFAAALALHASAGGWAVVTLDSLPEHLVAGRPWTVGFTVRQHGQHPIAQLDPSVRAVSGRRVITASALPSGAPGHYQASLTVPATGPWVITVDSGFAASGLTLLPLQALSPGGAPPPQSESERGRQLFVAKGCATCHQHAVTGAKPSLGVAPALAGGKHPPEVLSRVLADPERALPPSDRPVGAMPNLHLDPGEIGALVAFINAPADKLRTVGAHAGR